MSPNDRLYWLTYLLWILLWTPQVISALVRRGFTAQQMRDRGHTDEEGFLPFVWHGPAMWGNLIVVPYVMAEISVVHKWWQSPPLRLFALAIAGFAVSAFLHHRIWKHGKTPEEHNKRPGELSPTGHIQVFYLSFVLMILFDSSIAVGGLPIWSASKIIAPLWIYLVSSTHVLPWLFERPFWHSNPLQDPMGLSTIFGSAGALGLVLVRIVFFRRL